MTEEKKKEEVVTIRIEKENYDFLKKFAKKEEITMSVLLRKAIKEYVKKLKLIAFSLDE